MVVDETLYEHAGGEAALHRLEQIFYEKAPAQPILSRPLARRVGVAT